jgi:hypothetical protein
MTIANCTTESRKRKDGMGNFLTANILTPLAKCKVKSDWIATLEIEFLPFSPKCRRVNAQKGGSFIKIFGNSEYLDNVLAFRLFKREGMDSRWSDHLELLWKVLHQDAAPVSEQHSPFNNILQFPDISLPRIPRKCIHYFRCDLNMTSKLL